MIISLHIPKTAGKSFKAALKEEYGSNLVFDYGANPQKNISKYVHFRKKLKVYKLQFFPNKIKIIHGHFCLDQFKTFPSSFPRICFAREPLSLLKSFYDYTHLKANQEPRLKDTYKEIIESKLEDFLLSSYAQNFYSRMFGKFDYRKFHFIGVVEKYEESLNIFNQLFGTSLSSHHVNKTKSMGNRISNQVTLSEDFKIKFKIFHKFNYDFYNYALSSLNK